MNHEVKKSWQDHIQRNVIVDANTGCWEWTRSTNNKGYGGSIVPGNRSGQMPGVPRQMTSHRLSYLAFKGEIPDGLFVCHSCDNRKCANPDHLWLGNVSENWHDRINKREAEGIYAIHTLRQMKRK